MGTSNLPIVQFDSSGDAIGRWWSPTSDGRILCQLCPRACRLRPDDRGFCFVRVNRGGQMVLDTYARSTGFCIDPIEKKPLNHFFPGTPVLSFGTAGCNLGCKFCQNWDISKSREVAKLSDRATPDDIALSAKNHGCRSVAFTYNDPVIWAEYALDTAVACHARNIQTVAVTAGYITAEARGEFFAAMDAANIDLKAFTEEFYFRQTGAHLEPVLDTIRYACRETECWVELTNLVIPSANDHFDELRRMCDWVLDAVGADVPVHFTAFHPDFRMRDRPATSHETLAMAYDLAREAGLRYVYVGNVHDVARQSTYCPSCNQLLIQRDWHELGAYALDGNRCRYCDYELAGRFESPPGDEPVPGNWGRRRLPIRIDSASAQEPSTDEQSTNRVQVAPHENLMSTPSRSTTDTPLFTREELDQVHEAACQYVAAAVNHQPVDEKELLGPLATRAVAGMYVTLKRGDTLRGCCGMQGPPIALSDALADSATRTALHDPRMAPIAAMELPHLTLSVSLLGPPRPIGATGDDRVDAVEVGKHGLRIRMNNKVGLLLPVVARERRWTSRQFLDALCHKAGLPPGAWRSDDAVIEIFDGVDFSSPMKIKNPTDPSDRVAFSEDSLRRLRQWVHGNLAALQSGATPLYYATDVEDATVPGVVLQVTCDATQSPAGWMELSIREGVPLQSTLFQLTQSAATALGQNGRVQDWQVELSLLSAVVHHGTDIEHDLAGVECDCRALLAMDGRRWSVTFDRSASLDQLLESTLNAQPFRSGGTMIYSAVCDSTTTVFSLSQGPQAIHQISVRPPAVAGTFYPAEDDDREALVSQLLADLPQIEKHTVEAAMVPHAGLRYSGRIAADTWRRIQLPKSVLIIGPKHTPDGVDWAVAPHESWRLSATAEIRGDIDLANRIASSVPGMELDSAAHAREHGIETQLPILFRLAPQTRVTAIAMTGGTFDELKRAAQALAKCLAELDEPPLMVISSDMNHFADDVENRRRDRLALSQLEQIAPERLLQVCHSENISMCGKLPAALVLLTLRFLDRRRQPRYQEVAYGTSGDVSGDKTSVVGYAGILF